ERARGRLPPGSRRRRKRRADEAHARQLALRELAAVWIDDHPAPVVEQPVGGYGPALHGDAAKRLHRVDVEAAQVADHDAVVLYTLVAGSVHVAVNLTPVPRRRLVSHHT